MADDLDRYDTWYTRKLWELLPAIYRADDSDDVDANGPLRELVDRIGTQAAIVRRSIDRLWEDQSIETCDDWIIDYIGDLLATNLVASLDAHGKRIDVGKTIYYRRRKGTVALLEELAGDITGWSVRVVEFFRGMSRTRHRLDPAIGLPASAATARGMLQREEKLVGTRTGTCAGGFADLRNVHGANLTGSAYDEYFHTGDVRRGLGPTGRYDIPRLGVFVWRLDSLGVSGVTAVQDGDCPNQYTFDPTGRDIPLFAADDRQYGDLWVSPVEHEVPGPISRPLLTAAFAHLYRSADDANSISVRRYVAGPVGHDYMLVPAGEVSPDLGRSPGRFTIDPTRGRLIEPVGSATLGPYRVDYHYGFAAEIGAGPYDRRIPLDPHAPRVSPPPPPVPEIHVATGDAQLAAGIARLTPAPLRSGTIWIDDSLTYVDLDEVTPIGHVAIRAKNLCRPLVRPTRPQWIFEGADASSTLVLDGLFVGGGVDIVLRGTFARVALSCCTFDPGTWGPDPPRTDDWRLAADLRKLAPSHLHVEGNVRVLDIERCILGPIVGLGTFGAETLAIHDSIVAAADRRERALWLANGEVSLERCTILGRAQLHRLDASESILHDDTQVDDTQHGCVRFTAWATGSTLPRRYESVPITPAAELFVSRGFGSPAYAQLMATAGPAILEGAQSGSEMGAFSREQCAIKERSLLVKYQEYLPIGVEPVVIHVT